MKQEMTLKIINSTKMLKQEIMDKMLSKQDLFVKYSDVFLLAPIEKQSGAKIGNFVRQLKELSRSTLEYASNSLPLSGAKAPKHAHEIDLYVKTDDKELSNKSEKLLSVLYEEFLEKGIYIKLHALNGANDKFAVAVNKMINNYQIAKIRRQSNQMIK